MKRLDTFLNKEVSSAPLVVLRIALGVLIAMELLHFWVNAGFLDNYYFNTNIHFSFPGFEWVPIISGGLMKVYVIGLIGLLLVFVSGWKFRLVSVVTFFFYGWFFFMERAAYLNHWYLNLLFLFLLMFLNAENPVRKVGNWQRLIIIFLISVVYFFSGLAKFNADWFSGATLLMHAKNFIGEGRGLLSAVVLNEETIQFVGIAVALVEVLLPFTLIYKPTRTPSFIIAVLFHVINRLLFSIGAFPLVMICITALYYDPEQIERVLLKLRIKKANAELPNIKLTKGLAVLFGSFVLLQCFLPLRQHFYSENVLWTDRCVLFSWRMFTAAKKTRMTMLVYHQKTGDIEVYPVETLLTNGQISKTMRSPDLILQTAHHIADKYAKEKEVNIEVHVECENALNGRAFQKFTDVQRDLLLESRQLFLPYDWIIPLQDN